MTKPAQMMVTIFIVVYVISLVNCGIFKFNQAEDMQVADFHFIGEKKIKAAGRLF